MSSILRSLVVAVVGLAGCFLQASEGPFSIATVGNAYAFVRGDGTFVVRGIPAFPAWRSNGDGTVTPTEPFQYLVRIATPLGRGSSVERFTIPLQFTGDPAVVEAPSIVFDSPPENIRLRLLATVSATELAFGETARMTVIKVAGNNARSDITSDPATIYTSSNPLVASVSRAGVIEAGKRRFPSVAVITAMHDGLAATATVRVVAAAADSDGDGIADEWEAAFGFNPYDPGDAGLDPDGDGLANLREYELGTNPAELDTDRDGLNDREDDDPLVLESISPTIDILFPLLGQSFKANDIVNLGAMTLDNARVVRMQFLINGIDIGTSLDDAIQSDFRMGDYSSGQPVIVEAHAWDVAGNEGIQIITVNPKPNTIQIEQPANGQEVEQGKTIFITARADGFFQVTKLRCVANGIELAATDGPSLVTAVEMPNSISSGDISIMFYATGENGEVYANSVAVRLKNVYGSAAIVDGRVMVNGQPVPGAWVRTSDGSLIRSGPDGRFAIVRAIVTSHPLVLQIWADIDGQVVATERTFSPFGVGANGSVYAMSLGDIALIPGPILAGQMGDLTTEGQAVDLPAPVVFYGRSYHRIVVRAGQISFGADSATANDDAWRAGPPVAVVLNSQGGVSVDRSALPGGAPLGQYVRADRNGVTVTWLGIRRLNDGVLTLSAQLNIATDGGMRFIYGDHAFASPGARIGLYPGGDRGVPQTFDLDAGPSSIDSNGDNPIRLDGSKYVSAVDSLLIFTPTPLGGYILTKSRPTPSLSDPSLTGRLLVGDQPLADAVVRLSTGHSAITDANGRFGFIPVGLQRPIFVAGDASPGGDGRSWSTAYQSLEQAVRYAEYGDEIWVKAGIYPGQNLYVGGVAVFGGFAGTESNRDQRDWRAHPTRLQGGTMSIQNYIGSTHLDGLWFEASDGSQSSGGVSVQADSRPQPPTVIRNCVFTDYQVEYAMAAVEVMEGARVVFDRCIFADLRIRWPARAIAIANAGTAILSNCLFTGNDAQGPIPVIWSGGNSVLGLSHCTLARNQSGGSSCVAGEGRLIVQNSIINTEVGAGISDALGRGEIYDSMVSAWSGVWLGSVSPGSHPAFVDFARPRGADGIWGTADDGLALVPGSPGVDAIAGLNQIIDLAGCGRPAGGGTDSGAYEAQSAPVSIPEGPLPFYLFQRLWSPANLTLTVTDPDTGEIYTIPNIGILPHRSSDTGDITVGQPIPGGIGLRIPTADPSRTLTLQLAARGRP